MFPFSCYTKRNITRSRGVLGLGVVLAFLVIMDFIHPRSRGKDNERQAIFTMGIDANATWDQSSLMTTLMPLEVSPTPLAVDLHKPSYYDSLANVNVSNLLRRYHQQVKNDTDCRKVGQDPISWWRTLPDAPSQFTADVDFIRIFKAQMCGGFMIPEFLLTPVKRQLYPFEADYFADKPCEDLLNASDERFSTVKLLNHSKQFQVGDRVVFQITIKDGRGNARRKGGDVIRVWFKDQQKMRLSNRVTAQVVDLKNGTYLALAVLPWAGTVKIIAALAYPREYMRALLYIHHSIKNMAGVTAKFENSKASESTPCFSDPLLPGFSSTEVCNLTEANGSPWFCGHPVKKELSCSDFKFTRNTRCPQKYLPVTDAEILLLNRTCRNPRIRPIPNNIIILVKSDAKGRGILPASPTPCHEVDARLTWNQKEPTGYFLGSQWRSFLCTPTPTSKECIRNKTLLLLGDSNNRRHYYHYVDLAQCDQIKRALTDKWHAPLLCVRPTMNFTIKWNPHSQPFIASSTIFTDINDLVPSTRVLDEIPNDGRHYWIILNHYYHLTTFHISSIEHKMRYLKEGVQRLLARNPNVLVLLQGPHISWVGWPIHYAAGDSLGQFIMDIQKEVFKDLQDRVLYMYTWDMTVAGENYDYHPTQHKYFTQMINGFLCGRKS